MDLTYSKEQIEKILNLINQLPYLIAQPKNGIQSAMTIVEIQNILNSPIKKDIQEIVKEWFYGYTWRLFR